MVALSVEQPSRKTPAKAARLGLLPLPLEEAEDQACLFCLSLAVTAELAAAIGPAFPMDGGLATIS